MTIVNTATEDELSETIATKLIKQVVPNGNVGLKLRKGGFGYLKLNLDKFRQMARREHVLVLTDLDRGQCAPSLITSWTGNDPLPNKLIFRVAVREVEAWLLADRLGLSTLLNVSEASLPPNPDALEDPKQALLIAARRADRGVRSELLAVRGSLASQGLGYNRVLCQFVDGMWDIRRAAQNSASLARTVARLAALT